MNKEQLFNDNTKLIWSVIYDNYRHLYDLHEELYQVGSMGLWKAAEGYDESAATQFSTYAISIIKGEIKKFILLENNTFKNFSGIIYNLTNLILKMKNDNTKNETWEAAQKTFGDKVDHQMFNMCYAKLNNHTSLDSMLEDGNPVAEHDKTINIEAETESKLMCEYYISLCDKFKHKLGERTVEIYKDYLSQKANGTFESFNVLGDRWGVSRFFVIQIIKQIKMFCALLR